MMRPEDSPDPEDELLRPLRRYGRKYYFLIASLSAVVVWAVYAYYVQFTTGLGVTGMRSTVSWGFYIINFIFFIGISHVGALMLAILRLSNAEWRKPITRMAEVVTATSLFVAALFPLMDLGRPERIINVLIYGRLQSPLTWDFIAIGTYLTGSLAFLYLPMIPDIARCRDRLKSVSRVRRLIYRVLSAGWRGSEVQMETLKRAIKVMTIIIIPIAISVHTVVSWDFAMTLRTPWNSSIFGPYFVGGALFSGVATVITVMAVLTKIDRLDNYISIRHFHNLGKLLLALNIVLVYFTINEFLVPAYKHLQQPTSEGVFFSALFWGQYAPYFWVQIIGGLILPAFIVAIPKTRTINGYLTASILVNIGMWIERFNIVVPGLALPQLPYSWGVYYPTWVEISITAGAFAGFALLYSIFTRIFPIVPIWEREETPHAPHGQRGNKPTATHPVGKVGGGVGYSRRSFLSALGAGLAGFTIGTVAMKGLPGVLARATGDGDNKGKGPTTPIANLGRSVTLEEAQSISEIPIQLPSHLPRGTVLKDLRINERNGVVAALYENPSLPKLATYSEPVNALLLIAPDRGFEAPSRFLPSDFRRVEVGGEVGYGREARSAWEPGQLRWWSGGSRYILFSMLPLSTLIEIASSTMR